MSSILFQAMERIADMEKEALKSVTVNGKAVSADAVPYASYQQESFPYFTNRLASRSPEFLGDDTEVRTYRIIVRLVIGHITEGYRGEIQTIAYEYIPAVLDFFQANDFLTSTNYPDPLDNVYPVGITVMEMAGPTALTNVGTIATQVGVEFALDLPLCDQVY